MDLQKTNKKKRNWGLFIVGLIFLILLIKSIFLIWDFFVDKKINIKKSENGNVNILLMGIGGENHEGPDLTDTIIFANLEPDKNVVNLISIPRDLYLDSIGAKVNSAYAIGQEKDGRGMTLASAAVGSVIGVNPDYVFIIDFSGFTKLVDLLGGIDVNVENTLDDFAYPVEGKEKDLCGLTEDSLATLSAQIATGSATEFDLFPCRFSHLHVGDGNQHMDGNLALKFVRSRHALGVEGSDFARSKRQQLVINALKSKVLSLGTLANPVKVIQIVGILKDNIFTDIPQGQYDDFIKLAQKMKGAKINSYVIDQGDSYNDRLGLLKNPPLSDYGGQWVLAPRVGRGDFSEVKEFVNCIISGKKCEVGREGIVLISPSPKSNKN